MSLNEDKNHEAEPSNEPEGTSNGGGRLYPVRPITDDVVMRVEAPINIRIHPLLKTQDWGVFDTVYSYLKFDGSTGKERDVQVWLGGGALKNRFMRDPVKIKRASEQGPLVPYRDLDILCVGEHGDVATVKYILVENWMSDDPKGWPSFFAPHPGVALIRDNKTGSLEIKSAEEMPRLRRMRQSGRVETFPYPITPYRVVDFQPKDYFGMKGVIVAKLVPQGCDHLPEKLRPSPIDMGFADYEKFEEETEIRVNQDRE